MDEKVKFKTRSHPIPKEVNHFVIKNYGAIYYNSIDVNQKIRLLKDIEIQLKKAGFDISWCALERRLKNMKSHYRRKKLDLSFNISSSVCWEYYDELDRIFNNMGFTRESSESKNDNIAEVAKTESTQEVKKEKHSATVSASIALPLTVIAAASSGEKRNYPEILKKDPCHELPLKQAKVIEFSHVNDIMNQFAKKNPETIPGPAMNISGEELLLNISESIKAIDQQRIFLDQQRVGLEIRRHELDKVGYQLSQLLCKVIHSTKTN